MNILLFTKYNSNNYNFITDILDSGMAISYSMYPTDALESNDENIQKVSQFAFCTGIRIYQVEFIDGLVKWKSLKEISCIM